jgi:hypothetical protein
LKNPNPTLQVRDSTAHNLHSEFFDTTVGL